MCFLELSDFWKRICHIQTVERFYAHYSIPSIILSLRQLAEKWLVNYGSIYLKQSSSEPELVGRLIKHVLDAREVQNEAIVNLTWELCRITDADFILVLSMLEHIPGAEVEALALKTMQSDSPGAHLIAGPLLARNSKL